MVVPKYGIRPRPQEGESFTSFLIRVSNMNSTRITEIIRSIKKSNINITRQSYLLDMYPEKYIDVKQFAQWIKLSNESLDTLTFSPLLQKLYSKEELTAVDRKRLNISESLIKNVRRFCPECLRNGTGFKLLWQVAEIRICEIHKAKLVSRCGHCLENQPYISESFGQLLCFNGCSNLYEQKADKETNANTVEQQLKLIDDWNVMLDPKSNFVPNLDGLNPEQSLATMILYITQSDKTNFNPISNFVLSTHDIYFYRKLIALGHHERKITVDRMLSIIRESGYSVRGLTKLSIPDGFVRSMVESLHQEENRFCLTPWCEAYETDTYMVLMSSAPSGERKGMKYRIRHVCTKCYLQYGQDLNNGEWKSIDNMLEMIQKTKSLLKRDSTINKIAKQLEVSRTAVEKCIGYLVYHKLLEKELLRRFTPKEQLEMEIVEYFRHLVLKGEKKIGLQTSASRIYGWKALTFYYYYWHPRVQDYLIFQVPKERNERYSMQRPIIYTKEEIGPKVLEVLQTMFDLDEDINVRAVGNHLDVSNDTLRRRGQIPVIRAAAKRQIIRRKHIERKRLLGLAKKYVEKCNAENAVITAKNTTENLGYNSDYIIKTYPWLFKWMSIQSQRSSQHFRSEKVEEYKAAIKALALDLYQSGEQLTNKKIKYHIGIDSGSLYSTYPELLAFIKDIQANLNHYMSSEN